MKAIAIVIFSFFLVLTISCAEDDGSSPPMKRPDLLPCITLKSSPDMHVDFRLNNTMSTDLVYAVDTGNPKENTLGHLDGALYQDGEFYKTGFVSVNKPRLQKKHIRRLKSGESLLIKFRLPYTTVKPGMYELIMEYVIDPGSAYAVDFSITPMSIKKTIVLHVVE